MVNERKQPFFFMKPAKLISGVLYLLISGIASMATSSIAGELPDLGNTASAVLSPTQELELGRTVMKELKSASLISRDAIVNEYLQSLGNRLIATHHSTMTYHFFAVNDKTINAFALPGGFVGINNGLILATESESELAGVMAHEVAHVQQKHIARMYEHMGRLRLSTIAGVLASVLLTAVNPQAGSGAMAATLAGNQQALINFTREHEKEADYIGIQALAKGGFDPMGMPAFFHRMYQDTRYNGNHIPEYLMTHPLTESRLMVSQSRAKNYPYKQIPDSLAYHLVHARIRLRSFGSLPEASHYFDQVLKRGNYRNYFGTVYGYALALLEEGKPTQAKPYLDELITTYPHQPLFQLAYAQMEMALHQSEQALHRLSTAVKNHPSNYALNLTYCDWLIKLGDAAQAIPLLQQQSKRKATYADTWHLLSKAYAQMQQPVQSRLAQAQYLKQLGDLTGAMNQLKLAKKIASISEKESRQIDAELSDIQKSMNT